MEHSVPRTWYMARARSIPAVDGVLWSMIVLVGGMLSWLSVARYAGYNVGMFDLGNMSQAIGSVLRGQPLVFTYKTGPMSRLALHVELIYYLFVPFYLIWSDPRLLLIAQAVLFALGALPAYRLTLRRTESVFAARCVALIYLLYPTAQTSVLFDFHGDTLALPLLLFTLDDLDQRAWRRYAVFVVLSLMCKFYVALPVALLSLLIWHQYKERRVAVLTFIGACTYGALAFFLIRQAFTGISNGFEHQGAVGYIEFYFGRLNELFATFGDRLISAIIVFGPALFIAWRGWRWLLPAAPIAAAALLSTGPAGAYDYRYHHYALVVPFIIMAIIDGLARIQQRNRLLPATRRRNWRGDLILTLGIVAIFFILLVDTPLNPTFWTGGVATGRGHSRYGVVARDVLKDAFVREFVPPDAALAASNQLAPHLTNRATLYLLRYPDEAPDSLVLAQHLTEVKYAAADALFDLYLPFAGGYAGGLTYDRAAIGTLLRYPAFGLTAMRDGLLLFERGAPPARVLTNTLALLPDDGAPAEQQFGQAVALVQHSITPLGPRRRRVQFTWRLTGGFSPNKYYVAVSHLDGVAGARFVHLPGYALLPSWKWQPGQLVQETFDVELPPTVQAGTYTWRTGWYDIGLPYSYATDARSLLPGSTDAVISTVALP